METFILIIILALPSGDAHEYVVETDIKTMDECMEQGKDFEHLNGKGLAWECAPDLAISYE